MFERTKKINGHEYRYLVKSVRVDGKMKQKFIKYLGKVIPDQEEKLEEIKLTSLVGSVKPTVDKEITRRKIEEDRENWG
jgi:hypothetical protein